MINNRSALLVTVLCIVAGAVAYNDLTLSLLNDTPSPGTPCGPNLQQFYDACGECGGDNTTCVCSAGYLGLDESQVANALLCHVDRTLSSQVLSVKAKLDALRQSVRDAGVDASKSLAYDKWIEALLEFCSGSTNVCPLNLRSFDVLNFVFNWELRNAVSADTDGVGIPGQEPAFTTWTLHFDSTCAATGDIAALDQELADFWGVSRGSIDLVSTSATEVELTLHLLFFAKGAVLAERLGDATLTGELASSHLSCLRNVTGTGGVVYPRPTAAPTPAPTGSPTASPTTGTPTSSPTASPTTGTPTSSPTASPTTGTPTGSPTASPTTAAPTTGTPVTASPTTAAPTTGTPVTASPVTANPTTGTPTSSPVTASPVTASPVTASPVTASPVTASPVTASPVTASPVTASPVTASPVTASPVTASPVTGSPTGTPTPVPPEGAFFATTNPSGSAVFFSVLDQNFAVISSVPIMVDNGAKKRELVQATNIYSLTVEPLGDGFNLFALGTVPGLSGTQLITMSPVNQGGAVIGSANASFSPDQDPPVSIGFNNNGDLYVSFPDRVDHIDQNGTVLSSEPRTDVASFIARNPCAVLTATYELRITSDQISLHTQIPNHTSTSLGLDLPTSIVPTSFTWVPTAGEFALTTDAGTVFMVRTDGQVTEAATVVPEGLTGVVAATGESQGGEVCDRRGGSPHFWALIGGPAMVKLDSTTLAPLTIPVPLGADELEDIVAVDTFQLSAQQAAPAPPAPPAQAIKVVTTRHAQLRDLAKRQEDETLLFTLRTSIDGDDVNLFIEIVSPEGGPPEPFRQVVISGGASLEPIRTIVFDPVTLHLVVPIMTSADRSYISLLHIDVTGFTDDAFVLPAQQIASEGNFTVVGAVTEYCNPVSGTGTFSIFVRDEAADLYKVVNYNDSPRTEPFGFLTPILPISSVESGDTVAAVWDPAFDRMLLHTIQPTSGSVYFTAEKGRVGSTATAFVYDEEPIDVLALALSDASGLMCTNPPPTVERVVATYTVPKGFEGYEILADAFTFDHPGTQWVVYRSTLGQAMDTIVLEGTRISGSETSWATVGAALESCQQTLNETECIISGVEAMTYAANFFAFEVHVNPRGDFESVFSDAANQLYTSWFNQYFQSNQRWQVHIPADAQEAIVITGIVDVNRQNLREEFADGFANDELVPFLQGLSTDEICFTSLTSAMPQPGQYAQPLLCAS